MPSKNVKAIVTVQIVNWEEVARTLEVSYKECQDFLIHFHDVQGNFSMFESMDPMGVVAQGTMLNVRGIHRKIVTDVSKGIHMPVQVEYIWTHIESLLCDGSKESVPDFVWLWNPSN